MASGMETIASGHGDNESSRDFECMLLLLVESIRCTVHVHGFISGHSALKVQQIARGSSVHRLPTLSLPAFFAWCSHLCSCFNLASHFSDFQIPRSCFLIICHILHILYFCGLCKYFQHCKCKITTIKLTNL